MAKKGELFPDEKGKSKDGVPSTIGDDECLERRLPGGGAQPDEGELPKAAFTRDQLKWRKGQGGASVHRSKYVQGAVGGQRGGRGTIKARTGDIRDQVDESGNRKWHVNATPQQDDPSHAEIYRDPKGAKPTARDKEEFLMAWESPASELRRCKELRPNGWVEVAAVGDGGLRLRWADGHGNIESVGQVATVHEAVQALIKADIIRFEDAAQESKRLQAEVTRLLKGDYAHRAGGKSPTPSI